jgi:hypothetical protein
MAVTSIAGRLRRLERRIPLPPEMVEVWFVTDGIAELRETGETISVDELAERLPPPRTRRLVVEFV